MSFPTSMRALLGKYPSARRIAQIRIFDREGAVIELEGEIADHEVTAIVSRAFRITPPESEEVERNVRGPGSPLPTSAGEHEGETTK